MDKRYQKFQLHTVFHTFFTIHCFLSSVSGCIGTVLHFLRLHREKVLHYSAFGGKTSFFTKEML